MGTWLLLQWKGVEQSVGEVLPSITVLLVAPQIITTTTVTIATLFVEHFSSIQDKVLHIGKNSKYCVVILNDLTI